MKIFDILKEENIGKKFKFNLDDRVYTVERVVDDIYRLADNDGYDITYHHYLSEVLKGDYEEFKIYKLTRCEYEVFKCIKHCSGYCNNCGIFESCDDIEDMLKHKLGGLMLNDIYESDIEIID